MDQKTTFIIVGILFLVGIALGIYFLFFNKKTKLSGEVGIEITPGLAEQYDASVLHPLITLNSVFSFVNTDDRQLIDSRAVTSFTIEYFDGTPDTGRRFGSSTRDFSSPDEGSDYTYSLSTVLTGDTTNFPGKLLDDNSQDAIDAIYFRLTYTDGTTIFDWPGAESKEIPFGTSTDENIGNFIDALKQDDPQQVIDALREMIDNGVVLFAEDFTGAPSSSSINIGSGLTDVNRVKLVFKNYPGSEYIGLLSSGSDDEGNSYLRIAGLPASQVIDAETEAPINDDKDYTFSKRPGYTEYIIITTRRNGLLIHTDEGLKLLKNGAWGSSDADDSLLHIESLDGQRLFPELVVDTLDGDYLLRNTYYAENVAGQPARNAYTGEYPTGWTDMVSIHPEFYRVNITTNSDKTINITLLDHDYDLDPVPPEETKGKMHSAKIIYSGNREHIYLQNTLVDIIGYYIFSTLPRQGISATDQIDPENTEMQFNIYNLDGQKISFSDSFLS